MILRLIFLLELPLKLKMVGAVFLWCSSGLARCHMARVEIRCFSWFRLACIRMLTSYTVRLHLFFSSLRNVVLPTGEEG